LSKDKDYFKLSIFHKVIDFYVILLELELKHFEKAIVLNRNYTNISPQYYVWRMIIECYEALKYRVTKNSLVLKRVACGNAGGGS
jgi:hypothetical protein